MLGTSQQYNLGYEGVRIEEKDKKENSNVKQCLHKVADGHFTTNLKVLGTYEVLPYN